MNQKEVLEYIKKLSDEEQQLYTKGNLSEEELERKDKIEKEIDQYFDLLRQRRALRNAGKDPDEAHLRKQKTVEHYKQ
jgi:hypothetical protein